MSDIQVPFNFQPVSVSVKTGSYTIPAGQYAYVTAEVRDGGSFLIDGTAALDSDDYTVTPAPDSFDDTTYTVPSGYILKGVFLTGGSGSLLISGVNTATVNQDYEFAGGETIRCVGGTNAFLGSLRKMSTDTIATASFWLPTGTALTVSGNTRYTVSLYNNIS